MKHAIKSHTRNGEQIILNSAESIPIPRYFQNQLNAHRKALDNKKKKELIKLEEKIQKGIALLPTKNFNKKLFTTQKAKESLNEHQPLTKNDINQLKGSNSLASLLHEETGTVPYLPIISALSPSRASKIVADARIVEGIKNSIAVRGGKTISKSPNKFYELKKTENFYKEFLLGSVKERLSRHGFGKTSLFKTQNISLNGSTQTAFSGKKSKLAEAKLVVSDAKLKEFYRRNPISDSSHFSPDYIDKECDYIIKLLSDPVKDKKEPKIIVNAFKQAHKEIMKKSFTERPPSNHL